MRTVEGETLHSSWGPHLSLLLPSEPGAQLGGSGPVERVGY